MSDPTGNAESKVPLCNWFWGTHGCHLSDGHELPHVCRSDIDGEPCSEHDGHRARYHYQDGEWSEWLHNEGYTA